MSDALDRVAELVLRESGIRVEPAQHPALRSAHRPRGSRTATQPPSCALPRTRSGAAARSRRLIDEVTIKETFFFRDREQLDAIAWRALLEHAQAAGSQEVRVWCAACATGEEAYTLALLACEAFAPATPPVRILATDISTRGARACARRAVSRALAARPSTPGLRDQYFDAGRRPARRRRPLRRLVTLRSAQPRHGSDAAARRDGVRPDRLPQRADLLRRRDRRAGDRRASSRRCDRTGTLILGSADVLCGTARRLEQIGAESAPRGTSAAVCRACLCAGRSGLRERARAVADPLDAESRFLQGDRRARRRRGVRRGRVAAARPLPRPHVRPRCLRARPRSRGRGRPSRRAPRLPAGAAHDRPGRRTARPSARAGRPRRRRDGLPSAARSSAMSARLVIADDSPTRSSRSSRSP